MATAEELFNPQKADALLIVKFYNDAVQNKFKSHEQGRPVFDDIEMCEINMPGDRARSLLVPALSEWKRIGTRSISYAMRFGDHYKRFKANEGPVVEGTPLAEAPFLSMAQKASLKALQVYTVEQLASLTGQALKNIGAGGLATQQQAVAYLAKASGTADVVAMQRQIDELQAALAARDAMPPAAPPTEAPAVLYEMWSDEELKDHIGNRAGSRPRGQPSHDTLVRMAYELDEEVNAA